jgi:dTDP-4-amino-4,6-dideoxygalactose transaminase
MKLYPRLISLPLYPGMTEAQAQYVAKVTTEIARKARKGNPVFV